MDVIEKLRDKILSINEGAALKLCRGVDKEYQKVSNREENKYIYAYKYMKSIIHSDMSELLKYKAELIDDDYIEGRNSLFCILSFLVSIVAFFCSLRGISNDEYEILVKDEGRMFLIETQASSPFELGAIALLIVFCIMGGWILNYCKSLLTWRQYILVALDELEKEYEAEKNKKEVKVIMSVDKKVEEYKESLENVTENVQNNSTPSVLLQILKEEYVAERERADRLDNKASIFISAIIAIITIYIPIIPFDRFIGIYKGDDKIVIIATTVCICMLLLSVILVCISIYNLYNTISLKPFKRVRTTDLNDEAIQNADVIGVEKGLIDHYISILNDNADINDNKANKLNKGMRYSIISFVLLSLATICLVLII